MVRWDPFREVAALERQFDEMFGRRDGTTRIAVTAADGRSSTSGAQSEPESATSRS